VTDFDTVLERLVSDPSFAAALSADPAGTLAGYQLSADERALLHSQVSGDAGGQTAVETRANQSSVFGMLTPLAGLGGLTEAVGFGQSAGGGIGHAVGTGLNQPTGAGFGQAVPPAEGFGVATGGSGSGPAGAGVGQTIGAGWGSGTAGLGEAAYAEGFGASTGTGSAGLGSATAGGGLAGLGDAIGQDLSQAPAMGSSASMADVAPPEGYHTRVDVDGDGRWDRHTLHGRADGGVDIHVDLNRDGQVDFIGRDDDADGLVDSASYDKDHDGFFEKRMYDDNGDGWLDRTVRQPPPG